MPPSSVLIFAPSPHGGLAEHVHYQANELSSRGIDVTVLCTKKFIKPAGTTRYRQRRSLLVASETGAFSRIARVLCIIAIHYQLAWAIIRLRPSLVLFEAFTEYGSPLWVWPHFLLSRMGLAYVANIHDPLRARHFGPGWLHTLSVKLAYAPLRGGLIHGPPPEGADIPARLRIRLAPVGIYEDHAAQALTLDVRKSLGIAADRFLFLAFGHIADRKNLDLLIEALPAFAGIDLLIVGNVTARRDRPVAWYADLAKRLGVASRVHFVIDYVPDDDVSSYFAASDAIALTYRADFVSQSGVLQIAANWNKPILASSGHGPLRDSVIQNQLGVFVEPDSAEAIAGGISRILAEQAEAPANFARYRARSTWRENIDKLLEVAS